MDSREIAEAAQARQRLMAGDTSLITVAVDAMGRETAEQLCAPDLVRRVPQLASGASQQADDVQTPPGGRAPRRQPPLSNPPTARNRPGADLTRGAAPGPRDRQETRREQDPRPEPSAKGRAAGAPQRSPASVSCRHHVFKLSRGGQVAAALQVSQTGQQKCAGGPAGRLREETAQVCRFLRKATPAGAAAESPGQPHFPGSHEFMERKMTTPSRENQPARDSDLLVSVVSSFVRTMPPSGDVMDSLRGLAGGDDDDIPRLERSDSPETPDAGLPAAGSSGTQEEKHPGPIIAEPFAISPETPDAGLPAAGSSGTQEEKHPGPIIAEPFAISEEKLPESFPEAEEKRRGSIQAEITAAQLAELAESNQRQLKELAEGVEIPYDLRRVHGLMEPLLVIGTPPAWVGQVEAMGTLSKVKGRLFKGPGSVTLTHPPGYDLAALQKLFSPITKKTVTFADKTPTLREVYRSTEMRAKLRAFMKKTLRDENLRFIELCDEYQGLPKFSQDGVSKAESETARYIVGPVKAREVNLSGPQREAILKSNEAVRRAAALRSAASDEAARQEAASQEAASQEEFAQEVQNAREEVWKMVDGMYRQELANTKWLQ